MSEDDRELELAKDMAYDAVAPLDRAYALGQITKDDWHAGVLSIIEPMYLGAATEQMGSGHSGTAEEWDQSRGIVMEAVSGSGTFLDVGCANGLLMASVKRWASEGGLAVEPYGVEIAPRVADLARERYPTWRDRIWTANADGWTPPMTFDMVRTAMEYVPHQDRENYVHHLLAHAVSPGGRLIIGKNNEEKGAPGIAEDLRSWGWLDVREVRRPSAHPRVESTVVWFDKD
jgi:SAM-dependent methyltransferase